MNNSIPLPTCYVIERILLQAECVISCSGDHQKKGIMHLHIQLQNFVIKMKILHIQSEVEVDHRKSVNLILSSLHKLLVGPHTNILFVII